MSLRALRHFVVVAEELHMHRAAERLHIAQPALSQQIKQLEQRLGVVLFSRANRRLTLTAAGEAFLHKTRLALEMADQAVLDAQRTARGEQGRLHLGYVSSAMYDSKLPGLLRRLRADWPGIELSLVQGDVQMLYEALLDLRLDIAIIRGIDTDPDKQQIVQNIVAYAHPRSMQIIAEGVETAEELKKVLELGVDGLQGYFLAKPANIPTRIAPAARQIIENSHSSDCG